MRGIIMTALAISLVTLFCMGMYTSMTHGFKFSKTTFSYSNSSSFFDGDTESTDKTYPLTKDGSVSIETTNGTVTVTSHEKPEVLVKIIKEGDKNDFPFVEAQTTSEPTSLSFKTVYKKNSCNAAISYELTIPTSAALSTETTNGSITVTDITGMVEAKSSNGSLTFQDTPQLASAKTTNGRISVDVDTITSQPGTILVKTTNGSISFNAKKIEKNAFSIRTTNGSITINLPEKLDQYRSDKNSASFTVDGKAYFEVETTNGSISINK